jgi:hypothetical protein
MTPCERVIYYRNEIHRLSEHHDARERLLIETFKQLITENEVLCRQKTSFPPDR